MERTDDHLLTLKDVARALGRSPGTVREMINAGEFPEGFPAPVKLYWQWRDVRQWIEKHKLLSELAKSGLPRKPLDLPGSAPEGRKPAGGKTDKG